MGDAAALAVSIGVGTEESLSDGIRFVEDVIGQPRHVLADTTVLARLAQSGTLNHACDALVVPDTSLGQCSIILVGTATPGDEDIELLGLRVARDTRERVKTGEIKLAFAGLHEVVVVACVGHDRIETDVQRSCLVWLIVVPLLRVGEEPVVHFRSNGWAHVAWDELVEERRETPEGEPGLDLAVREVDVVSVVCSTALLHRLDDVVEGVDDLSLMRRVDGETDMLEDEVVDLRARRSNYRHQTAVVWLLIKEVVVRGKESPRLSLLCNDLGPSHLLGQVAVPSAKRPHE
mmetsp:Transcript_62955/g.149143  ORF Transcript_62955/g.149143 Transcript_62955/m.149143 type:complete len:290 (+) Transcript_62955:449-1318(+)